MKNVNSIAIVGAGTAGLVSALILKTRFPNMKIDIICSKDIGIVGVGEGSTEHWKLFMEHVGIDSKDLIQRADATFKLGVMFQNWVEDDYLHFPEAINDMIESVSLFESMTGKMVAINPHDDIWRYRHQIYQSFLLLGPYRHYRSVRHTTATCLGSKVLFDKYKQHFNDLVTFLIRKEDWVEDKTINLVWNKDDVVLFSPIPGLALHIMDESGRDPYIDIAKLWDSIPELW
jgi:hypothetical protein